MAAFSPENGRFLYNMYNPFLRLLSQPHKIDWKQLEKEDCTNKGNILQSAARAICYTKAITKEEHPV